MKFSFLSDSAPGSSLEEKCEAIRRAGCQGVEALALPGQSLSDWQQDLRKSAANQGLEVAAVIVGGLALYKPGQLDWVSEAFHAAAELGAGALITPEYRAQDPLPLLPPYAPPPPDEQACVDAALDEISRLCGKLNMPVFCEPITAFQSRFWRDTQTVINVCRRLNNPLIGLALDTWVMNITEKSLPETVRQVGSLVRHVHLADNNRWLPGQGHIDFASCLRTLDEIGYSGWYSFECAVLGDFIPEVAHTLNWLIEQASGSE